MSDPGNGWVVGVARSSAGKSAIGKKCRNGNETLRDALGHVQTKGGGGASKVEVGRGGCVGGSKTRSGVAKDTLPVDG